jgi:arsenite methyltransferase
VNTCALEHPYQAGRHDSGTPLRPGGTELTLRALQCAGFAPGQRVLDLGCGVGIATRLLRRHGCQAFGVDLAVHRLALARREDPALALVAADGRRLPFADQSLDGILAECSLSLIGYSAATLAECRRVLRPGGRLAITDLYSRAQPGAEAVGAVAGCLGGMVTRNAMLAALAAAGLRLQRWEDHTERLKAFVAQLIFSGAGAQALWACDGPKGAAALRARRPGYCLLVATRPEPESPT